MENNVNNHEFRNPSEVGDELFSYLGQVRESDGQDSVQYNENTDPTLESDEPRFPGNGRTGTLSTRIPHISSDKPAYAGHRDLGRVTIMPRPMQRKHANTDGSDDKPGFFSRLGRLTLKDIEDFRYKTFAGNSALEGLAYGGLAALGTYALAPTAVKAIYGKPIGYDRRTGEPVYVDKTDRWQTSLGVGLGILGLNMLRHVKLGENFKLNQFWTMPKRASMLGPTDYVPTTFAMNAVTLDPNIPDYLKYNTLNALGTINAPMINSTDMVNAGINSGISGSTGFPVGRIAAAATADALTAYGVSKMFGADNPGKWAKATGVVSLLTRSLGNLI